MHKTGWLLTEYSTNVRARISVQPWTRKIAPGAVNSRGDARASGHVAINRGRCATAGNGRTGQVDCASAQPDAGNRATIARTSTFTTLLIVTSPLEVHDKQARRRLAVY